MLDRDRITRASQRSRDKRERHLAAARDEDVARIDSQTARRRQHRGERFSEPRQTGGIAVGEKGRSETVEHAAVSPSDQVGRHEPDIRSCA